MQVTEETLADVGREVLETMAFAVTVPEAREEDGAGMRAVVKFAGPLAGEFTLTLSAAVATSLANNMLGRDEQSPAEEGETRDAAGELANVMCGNLLARAAGPEPVFRLAAPVVSSIEEAAQARAGNEVRARVTLMEGSATLTVAFE